MDFRFYQFLMNKNWRDIKWIFESDGFLRDIYVQDISLQDWKLLIKYLNKSHKLIFDDLDKIDSNYVLTFLIDNNGEMDAKSVAINLDGIFVNCHFFIADQIEFDINPNDINSLKDYLKIEAFMKNISELLSNQVTLTGENSPKIPLIKIDVIKQINKAVTKIELTRLHKKFELKNNKLANLTKKELQEKMLKSANKSYCSTKKSDNLW